MSETIRRPYPWGMLVVALVLLLSGIRFLERSAENAPAPDPVSTALVDLPAFERIKDGQVENDEDLVGRVTVRSIPKDSELAEGDTVAVPGDWASFGVVGLRVPEESLLAGDLKPGDNLLIVRSAGGIERSWKAVALEVVPSTASGHVLVVAVSAADQLPLAVAAQSRLVVVRTGS